MRTVSRTETLYHVIQISVLVFCLFALAGCQSTMQVLSAVDYACVDIQADGPWTDSGMQGRGIVLPEGETLTEDTIAKLCE